MSGGTLIKLAAAEIVMDRNAVLGPVDPQIGDVAASSILKVVQIKKETANDETLMMADMAVKARAQVADFIADLLSKRLPRKKAEELAAALHRNAESSALGRQEIDGSCKNTLRRALRKDRDRETP
jgi:ClpP class serine protease